MPPTLLQTNPAPDLLPFIIYLVIFIVWAISRTLTVLSKGKRPEPDAEESSEEAAKEPRSEVSDALRELLETVTGTRSAERPPPARPKPPAPPPPIRTQKPPAPRDRAGPYQPTVHRPTSPPPRRPTPARPAPAVPPTPSTRAIEETEIRDHEPSASRPSIASFSSLAGLDAMRIPMISLRLPRRETGRPAQNRLDIRNRDAARRAMIERILLGPPRAFLPHPEDPPR